MNPTSHAADRPAATSASPPPELEQYGIVRVTSERYDFGGYSYVRLADAVAEARRRLAAAGDGS